MYPCSSLYLNLNWDLVFFMCLQQWSGLSFVEQSKLSEQSTETKI